MTYEIAIERGKVREFARAIRSRHPAFGDKDPCIPPTFLTTARLVWEPRNQDPTAELNLDRRRLLHGAEEFVFHGPPPRAGQTLHATTRLADMWEKEGRRGGRMRIALVVAEFRDELGTLVAEQRSTYIETARPPSTEG